MIPVPIEKMNEVEAYSLGYFAYGDKDNHENPFYPLGLDFSHLAKEWNEGWMDHKDNKTPRMLMKH